MTKKKEHKPQTPIYRPIEYSDLLFIEEVLRGVLYGEPQVLDLKKDPEGLRIQLEDAYARVKRILPKT